MTRSLLTGADGVTRCWWCGTDDLYRDYHDSEWGLPVQTNTRLFEKLCLEGFQCGLSWLTILRKRERFREVFEGFEIDRVARFRTSAVDRLVRDEGIIRHRGKIESTINNARRARELIDETGSLAAVVGRFRPARRPRRRHPSKIPASTTESTALSRELKRRGWSYVGPTTVYAFMQAVGLVNDHIVGCHVRELAEGQQCATSWVDGSSNTAIGGRSEHSNPPI